MRRILPLFLSALILFTTAVGLNSCGRKGNEDVVLEYELASDGASYRVKGSNISDQQLYYWGWDDVDVVVPATYNGLPVTEIADSAFYNAGAIRSIRLPNTIVEIGDAAFMGCIKLEKINIPDGVTVLDSNLFHSCESLLSLDIPASVEEISSDAFIGCSKLGGINVSEDSQHFKSEDGVLYSLDGKRLLFYCAGRTDIEFTVPDGVEEISGVAFSSNKSIETVYLPASIKIVNFKAFSGCESFRGVVIDEENPALVSIDGNVYTREGGVLVRYYYSEDGTFEIPEYITAIADYAFFDCSDLEEVIIPDGVTRIGRGAFMSTGLREIGIPESVTYIGAAAFSHCFDLKRVELASVSEWTVSDGTKTSVLPSDMLEDRRMAAKYLCTAYNGYTWERREVAETPAESGDAKELPQEP